MVLKWEDIGDREYRAKIQGGWLVKSIVSHSDGMGVGLTFVPDPEHSWEESSWSSTVKADIALEKEELRKKVIQFIEEEKEIVERDLKRKFGDNYLVFDILHDLVMDNVLVKVEMVDGNNRTVFAYRKK